MAEPGNNSSGRLRELAEEVLLAGVGAVALTKERADELVGELSAKGKLTQDDARNLVDEVMGRWRGDALRVFFEGGEAGEDEQLVLTAIAILAVVFVVGAAGLTEH